jgi:hypothetical protein
MHAKGAGVPEFGCSSARLNPSAAASGVRAVEVGGGCVELLPELPGASDEAQAASAVMAATAAAASAVPAITRRMVDHSGLAVCGCSACSSSGGRLLTSSRT